MFPNFNAYIKYINAYTDPILYVPNNTKNIVPNDLNHSHLNDLEWLNLFTSIEAKPSIKHVVISIKLFTQLERKIPDILHQSSKLISLEEGLLYAITRFDFKFIICLLSESPFDLNQPLKGLGGKSPLEFAVEQHSLCVEVGEGHPTTTVSHVQICSLIQILISKGARVVEPHFKSDQTPYQTPLSFAFNQIKEDLKEVKGGLYLPRPLSEKFDLLNILIERFTFVSIDQLEKQLNLAVHFLKEHDHKIDDSLLDHCVSRLTGCDIALEINTAEQKAIYIGHLLGIKGTKQTSLKVITNLERWYQELFLPHKIRNLFELLAKLDSGAIFLHEVVKYNLKTPQYKVQELHQVISTALKKEILCGLTTFHIRTMLDMIREVKNLQDKTELCQSLAAFLCVHLSTLLENSVFCFPVSWHYTKNSGHGVYVNFIRKKNSWMILIDNLGEGCDELYPNSEQRELHESQVTPKDSLLVRYPCVIEVQMDAVAFMGHYLERLITISTKNLSSLQECIWHVYPFDLLGKECINLFDKRDRLIFSEEIQTSGNCAVRNYQPGEKRRLMLHFTNMDTENIIQLYNSLINQELHFLKRNPQQIKGDATAQEWCEYEQTKPSLNKYTLEELYTIPPAIFNRLVLMAPIIIYQRELGTLGLIFSDDQSLQKFLDSKNRLMNYQVAHDVMLGSLRVYQTLQTLSGYIKNDSTLFIYLTMALSSPDLLNLASINDAKLVVLICDIDVRDGVKFIQTLLPKMSPQQKIILVTTKSQRVSEYLPANIASESINAENGFSALTPATQAIILSHQINFQGTHIPLNQLIDDPGRIIDAEILSELLSGREIRVGEPPENFEAKNYYIERTLIGVQILDKGLRKNTTDIFVVENMPQDDLNTIIGTIDLNRYIGIYSPIESLAQFQALCVANTQHSIHLLKRENNAFIWQRSQGSLFNIREYTQPISIDILPNAPSIISADPGMGKSTYLAHLAATNPNLWIVKINLGNKETQIKQASFNAFDEVIHFFMQNASLLEQKIFEERLKNGGDIALVLDGFDEIQAPQQQKILQLLQLLKTTAVEKIIVATREHMQETLEEALSVFAHHLKPFDEKDFYLFLDKFWKDALRLREINTKKVRIFGERLLSVFIGSTNDTERTFIGIPLQAKLLAGGFVEEFAKFYNEESGKIKLPANLSLAALYKRFISTKYNILFQEKRRFNEHQSLDEITHIYTTRLDTIHQQLAFEVLFPNAEMVGNTASFCTEDIGLIQATGIVQFIEREPRFVHRTFAEYFAALWLIKMLEELPNSEIHKGYKNFLIRNIFKDDNQVIYTFITQLVTVSTNAFLVQTWKEVLSRKFSSNKEVYLRFGNLLERSFSNFFCYSAFYDVVKNNRRISVQPVHSISYLTESVKKNEIVINGDYIYKAFIKAYSSNSSQVISKALLLLKNKIDGLIECNLHRDYISYSFDNNNLNAITHEFADILWRYIALCYCEGLIFDENLISVFGSSAYHPYLRDQYDDQSPVLERRISGMLTLHSYLDPHKPVTTDDVIELSEKINFEAVLKFWIIRDIPVNSRLFELLQSKYAEFEICNNDDYRTLLILGARQAGEEGLRFLWEQREYLLLEKVGLNFSEAQLPVKVVELCLDDEINGFQPEYGRYDGAMMVRGSRVLTARMATVFNAPLVGFGRANISLNYVGYIWENFLWPLLATDIVHSRFDKVALVSMYKLFMGFIIDEINEKEIMTIGRMEYSQIVLSIEEIQRLFQLIEATLNSLALTTAALYDCISLLDLFLGEKIKTSRYWLEKNAVRLHLIDIGSTLLFQAPSAEFEYEMKLTRYHQCVKNLLVFKSS